MDGVKIGQHVAVHHHWKGSITGQTWIEPIIRYEGTVVAATGGMLKIARVWCWMTWYEWIPREAAEPIAT